jgi:hypothetical protein
MRIRLAIATIALVAVFAAIALQVDAPAIARPAPSPSPSPTNPPTPYMAPEAVTNGTWDVILQLEGRDPSYSTMKLKDVGDTVSGVWIADKKTVYVLNGKRDGTHLTLDVATQAKPDTVIGKIDAEIDGIADMVGTITIDKIASPLNGAPFQAAMHARVPPPPEASPAPNPTATPF